VTQLKLDDASVPPPPPRATVLVIARVSFGGGTARHRNVKHHPTSHKQVVGRAGLEPATNGFANLRTLRCRAMLNSVVQQDN
jgi:hypothetical protein